MTVLRARIGSRRETFLYMSPASPRSGRTSPSAAHPAMQLGEALEAAPTHPRPRWHHGPARSRQPRPGHTSPEGPGPARRGEAAPDLRPRRLRPEAPAARFARLECECWGRTSSARCRTPPPQRNLETAGSPHLSRRAGCLPNAAAFRPQAVPKRNGWASEDVGCLLSACATVGCGPLHRKGRSGQTPCKAGCRACASGCGHRSHPAAWRW